MKCSSVLLFFCIALIAGCTRRSVDKSDAISGREDKSVISKPIVIFPGGAPGENGDIGEEKDTSKPGEGLVAGKPLIRLANVSAPTISIHRPPADKDTGASVLILPGGAYHILALDLEGTEVADWLNTIGVTGIVLKYRVPGRKGMARHAAALQDAQRALGYVRAHAEEWKIDPKRIGVLGFSAGGNLAAILCANSETRTYPAVDDFDKASCKPDFSVLIYPAYLTVKNEGKEISPDVAVTATTPPTFMVMTEDDGVKVENCLVYYLALKNAKVPAELHLYPSGGHGYGLRDQAKLNVTRWPKRAEEWMTASGWLERK